LRKYVEWLNRGRRTDRVAYVLDEWDLPVPLPGAEWARDSKFDAAEELQANPALEATFRDAIEKGVAVVTVKSTT
jgi:hypothetical protein